jgi:hypothetical protein
MPELELTIQKIIYKAHVTDMKTPTLRQGKTHARICANYTENVIYKTCVTDMKTQSLRQGEKHARVEAT